MKTKIFAFLLTVWLLGAFSLTAKGLDVGDLQGHP